MLPRLDDFARLAEQVRNNHDPNAPRQYTNPYMWMNGFEMRADSIPLTRSKQERNLFELAAWVERGIPRESL